VHTGVTVTHEGRGVTAVATTDVTFVDLDSDVLDWYVATGEPIDKAGAYAIQGAGALLVERVSGSVSNVIGIPLALLAELTAQIGITLVTITQR
jgi:septum formation protein